MAQMTRLGSSICGGGVVEGEEKEELRSTSDGAVDKARVEQTRRRDGGRKRRNEEYQ